MKTGNTYFAPVSCYHTGAGGAQRGFWHMDNLSTNKRRIFIRGGVITVGCDAPVAATSIGIQIYKSLVIPMTGGTVLTPTPARSSMPASILVAGSNLRNSDDQTGLTGAYGAKSIFGSWLAPASTGQASGPIWINLSDLFGSSELMKYMEILPGESFGFHTHANFAGITGQSMSGCIIWDETEV